MINRIGIDSINHIAKHAKSNSNNTALTMAAVLADQHTVQFLIEEVGMNPLSMTQKGYDERNCFLSAASGAKIGTLKYLNTNFLELKNKRDSQESTALTLAAYFADKNTVQFLVEEVGMNVTETGTESSNCFVYATGRSKTSVR